MIWRWPRMLAVLAVTVVPIAGAESSTMLIATNSSEEAAPANSIISAPAGTITVSATASPAAGSLR